ncbi:MAG: hypothetical protein ACHQXA_10790, partial [Gemmatimonadales bacterium]
MIALLLLLQGAPPKVGDTIWVTRAVSVPAGTALRPASWTLTGDVEVIGPGEVTVTGDAAAVRYPVVAWSPGAHTIEMPGPLLLHPGGAVDSLSAISVTITVTSVLPAAVPDSAIPPQPAATVVLPRETDPRTALLWFVAAVPIALAILLLRRRRPAPEALEPPIPAPVPFPPIARWAAAGETRVACEAAATRLRLAIHAAFEPAHPGLDTGTILRLLEGSRPQW